MTILPAAPRVEGRAHGDAELIGGCMQRFIPAAAALTAALAVSFTHIPAARAWEPTKSVEFIIPAGTGGGADQMARAVQGIVAKHGLMKQSIGRIDCFIRPCFAQSRASSRNTA